MVTILRTQVIETSILKGKNDLKEVCTYQIKLTKPVGQKIWRISKKKEEKNNNIVYFYHLVNYTKTSLRFIF